MKFGSKADDVWLIKLMTWNFVTARHRLPRRRENYNIAEKVPNYNFIFRRMSQHGYVSFRYQSQEEQINTDVGDVMEHYTARIRRTREYRRYNPF